MLKWRVCTRPMRLANRSFFVNVSDQIWSKNDQIEMKLHSEYDYEYIMNSLSIYPLLCQWLAIDPTWTALKVNNAHGFDKSFLIVFNQNTTLFIKFNFFLSFVMKYIPENYYIYFKKPNEHKAELAVCIWLWTSSKGGGGVKLWYFYIRIRSSLGRRYRYDI